MPTTARILELAPVCCYLAANYKGEQGLFSGVPKSAKNQSTLIYIYWKILNKIYTLDPTWPGLDAPANYLYELERPFSYKAAQIVDGGGGGSVTPITPTRNVMFEYLIEVFGGVPDFSNATDYNDTRITGHNLVLFLNNIPKFLTAGTEWFYTLSGVRIFLDDGSGGNSFDATVNDYDLKIFIKDPLGISGSGTEVTRSFQYDGVGSETSITAAVLNGATIISVTRGTPYEMITTGTPTDLQVLVNLGVNNLSNGTLNFAATNPISVGELVEVVFSKAI